MNQDLKTVFSVVRRALGAALFAALFAALMTTCFSTTDAFAQDGAVNNPGRQNADLSAGQFERPELTSALPTNHVLRPITLPRLHLRGTAGFWIGHDLGGDDVWAGMDLGAGFGITDDLEVGIASDRHGNNVRVNRGLIPLRFNGRGRKFGDMDLYGRFRFLDMDAFELAGEAVFEIPTNTDFAFSLGLPFRLRAGSFFALDGSLVARFPFVEVIEDGPGGTRRETDLQPEFNVVLSPRIAPIDPLYVAINTGFFTSFRGDGVRVLTIPFGLEAGYTFDVSVVKIEAFGALDFPTLFARLRTDLATNSDTFSNVWIIRFGARAFFDFAAD